MARMATGLLPWLAAVMRERREALPLERRNQAHFASAADVNQATIARFEKGEAWPRKLDAVLEAYATLTDTTEYELWSEALERWRSSTNGGRRRR